MDSKFEHFQFAFIFFIKPSLSESHKPFSLLLLLFLSRDIPFDTPLVLLLPLLIFLTSFPPSLPPLAL